MNYIIIIRLLAGKMIQQNSILDFKKKMFCLCSIQFEIWHVESETSYGGNDTRRKIKKKQTRSLLIFLSLFFNAI